MINITITIIIIYTPLFHNNHFFQLYNKFIMKNAE